MTNTSLTRWTLWLLALAAVAPAVAQPGDRRESATSPDGRRRAFVKTEPGEPGASGNPRSSLWLTDARTGRSRLLFRGQTSRDPKRDTASIARPDFSLDGGYVYVEADAHATSPAVHQIAVRDGREHFIADGGLIGVLRSGPWRGFLVIQQHRYRAGGGSYDPVLVYRPDGRQMAVVPGSDRDESRRPIDAWLRAKGWTLR